MSKSVLRVAHSSSNMKRTTVDFERACIDKNDLVLAGVEFWDEILDNCGASVAPACDIGLSDDDHQLIGERGSPTITIFCVLFDMGKLVHCLTCSLRTSQPFYGRNSNG